MQTVKTFDTDTGTWREVDHYSLTEVVDLLHASTRQIRQLIKADIVRPYYIHRSPHFCPEDIATMYAALGGTLAPAGTPVPTFPEPLT